MATAMVALALGCLVLSVAVMSGLSDPFLVGPAAQTLIAGVFAL